jgi:hypothetical protein
MRVMRCEIEARNVSSVPVTLKRVLIHGAPHDEVWFEYQGWKISGDIGLPEGVGIGGHKTAQFTLCFYVGEIESEDDTEYPWEITYLWEVHTFRRVNEWLRANTPAPLRRQIQNYQPSYDSAILEVESKQDASPVGNSTR